MTETLDRPRIRPLILLVEDKPSSLDRRRLLFESFDCAAVGVSSREEAERELRRTPLVDLVVTDIHMPTGPNDDEDSSGIDLARHVRSHYKGVPVAGYSAYFEEEQLPHAHEIFDVVFPKRAQSSIALETQVQACVDLATESRDRRLATVHDRLERLRREYEQDVSEVEIHRRLSLEREALDGSVEGSLEKAGYRLRLVSADFLSTAEPLVVWINEDDSGTYCEVYGQPEFYAFGATEAEALEQLADLLALVARDADTKSDLGSPAERIHGFLARMLPGRFGTRGES